ncbi:dol-P-Glc:Glc(2)Man(9)GlcNAc(2)-PP-Dol alpha-1,2-glucosyltransferase [Hyalella azteca]|uniref:Dol-P-Glc:Glc(2)Man(9)GlcNAc(2)-PP-Dol alpha-1,2-glucosyltransferase n=1 Tax=Hyalella azteca TaxID=294128 RepID=A0A8B7NQH1_HYAAZ|nr:dol-P-Glc:Glc(2)Man(9)GlcNAc(2)-PP-Dol alpha-1,2-glucosyltransferase [Hyalella azteca]
MRSSNRSPPPPYSPYPGACDSQCHYHHSGQPRQSPFEPLHLLPGDVNHQHVCHHRMTHEAHFQPTSQSSDDNFSQIYSTMHCDAVSSTSTTSNLPMSGCNFSNNHSPQNGYNNPPSNLLHGNNCANPSENFNNETIGMLNNYHARWYRKYCNYRVPAVVVFGVVAAVFSVTYLYMVVVYRLQPSPVVDEAFHIPQAQKYCSGKFDEWDPKLTTLPGLYLFSIGITGPISWILGKGDGKMSGAGKMNSDPELIVDPGDQNLFGSPDDKFIGSNNLNEDDNGQFIKSDKTIFKDKDVVKNKDVSESGEDDTICSVLMLRLVNVLVAPCILLTLHSLMCFMHGTQSSEWSCLGASVSMVLLPPLFWFYSLYYTEPLSTMLVLIMVLLFCHKNHNMAAAIGAVSILARQTNIVWVLLLLLLRAVDASLALLQESFCPPLHTLHTKQQFLMFARRIETLVRAGPACVVRFVVQLVRACLSYVLLMVAFAVFACVNGGLVVGDRTAHQPTLHLMQMFYFCLFYVLFSPLLALNHFLPFVSRCCANPKTTALALITVLSVVHYNTLVHPYLLADNRHYTFYLWNRFYGPNIYFRYLISPIYMYGAYLIWYVSLAQRSNVFKMIYVFCVALCLVPQKLLEPRYFILPFIIARIQNSPNFGFNNLDASDGDSASARFPCLQGESSTRIPSEGARTGAHLNRMTGSHSRVDFNSARHLSGRDGFRGAPLCRQSGTSSTRGVGRNSNYRGHFKNLYCCWYFMHGILKYLRGKVRSIVKYMPVAHIGWEFLYYLTINLATLAIFATKTFWWKDFAEPQRIMW